MRRFLLAAWLCGISFHIASLFLLPDRVAMHFGMDGTPNGWGRPMTHVAILVGLQTFLLLLVVVMPGIVRRTPRKFVNIPNRDYWLADERLDETVSRLQQHFDLLGIILQGFIIAIGVCVTSANLSEPIRLSNHAFLPTLAIFLLSISAWIVRLSLAFRIDDVAAVDGHE